MEKSKQSHTAGKDADIHRRIKCPTFYTKMGWHFDNVNNTPYQIRSTGIIMNGSKQIRGVYNKYLEPMNDCKVGI